MYKVFKPKGHSANVTVENIDTRANIIIGRVNTKMLEILKASGIEPPAFGEEWNLEVNKEAATALTALTMRMTKPIRDQRKPENKKKANKEIDAMDVLLGLAHYN